MNESTLTIRNRELWKQFIAGDDKAFAQLYRLNVQLMMYYGLYFTTTREIIGDAVQDVFVYIYSNRKKLKEVDNVKFYLYISLKNRLFEIFQKEKHHYQIDSIEPIFSMERSVEESFIDKEQETQRKMYIREMLRSLSPRQREIIHYRFTEGLSYDEISELMQLNYQSVRNLVNRSILRIRETYSDYRDIRYDINKYEENE